MNELFKVNGKEARNRVEEASNRADMKQHADKLIQGIEKLDDRQAKRAIWELFQNAIDISEKCEIIITLTDNTIEFQHNGKPFKAIELICLIKQVSSKNPKNDDEVGQYGTGFITTHSFGRKFLLSGSLEESDSFINFENFEIDRIAENSDEMIEKLENQQKNVFDLVENGKIETERTPFTTFTYQTESKSEKINAENAISKLRLILPYVMTINSKLQKVIVIDKNNNKTEYLKGDVSIENDLTITHIQINQEIQKIFSIPTEQNNFIIILPLEEQDKAINFDKNLSKLFLYYPLIGTENFGFNFLVHSKQFAPTVPRDTIHLGSNNEHIKDKENSNRELLQKAFHLTTDYITNHCSEIQNIHFLAELNFNTKIPDNQSLSDYFKIKKKEWVEKFKIFPFVETNGNRISPNETLFFDEKLLEDVNYFDSIYAIVNIFWQNIPKKEIAPKWTEYVTQWEDNSIEYITIEKVAEKIQNTKTLDHYKNTDDLKRFYEYLINTSRSEIFNNYEILPNIKNEFKRQSKLFSHSEIDDVLVEIADVIIPDVPKQYIHKGFEFKFPSPFTPYKKEQFVKDTNDAIANLKVDEDNWLDKDTKILQALIKYCSVSFSTEGKNIRDRLLKLLNEYYGLEQQPINISNFEEPEWWLTALRCLLRNFIWELNATNEDWTEERKEFLKELLEVVCESSYFKEILQIMPLFPNQLNKLCTAKDLKKDENISPDLKNLYDEIVNPSKPIREILILEGFSDVLETFFKKNLKNNVELKTPENLGSEIETKIIEQGDILKINEHPYKKHILDIIQKISDSETILWQNYFKIIDNKKASIMLERISDSGIKKNLFLIISLEPDKIALLGELSDKPNLKKIIELGEKALDEEQRNNANFLHKHKIGTYIEKLVREKIGDDLTKVEVPEQRSEQDVEVREQQRGQDIIVKYKDEIIHYIEIKSRWDTGNSIKMSKMQVDKAAKNKEKYSLICVDMCNYEVGNNEKRYNAPIEDIKNRSKVLSDVGAEIEPLIKEILSVENEKNKISVGDYSGTIPQNIVEQGNEFDCFVNNLIEIISR